MKEIVALVTGAASGIGKAVSHKLASRGISVVLADMDKTHGMAIAREIQQKYHVRAQFHQVNVANETEVRDLVSTSASLTGRLDYAANCAGIAEGNRLDEETITSEWFDKVHSVNTKGLWLCQKYEAAQMKMQKPRPISFIPASQLTIPGQRGAIANVVSISGLLAMGLAAYTPSKYGAVAVTKNGAKFYGPNAIRVNAVCPGWTMTAMTASSMGKAGIVGTKEYEDSEVNRNIALKRMAYAEEQANVVGFLLSDESSYMNGSLVVCDGGFHDLVN